MSVYRNTFLRTIIVLSSIVLVSFCTFWIIRTVFVIQEIEIAGDGISVVIDEKNMTKNLLFFPSDKFRKEILDENQLLENVVFRKKFPHTLIIQPVLRRAVAIIKTPDRTALVDSKGYVLEYGDQGKALPVLHFSTVSMQKGMKLTNDMVMFAIETTMRLATIEPVLSIVEKEGRSIEVVTEKNRIYFSQEIDLGSAIATLQTLIVGFRIKGTLPSVVDLRFDKPVVQF